MSLFLKKNYYMIIKKLLLLLIVLSSCLSRAQTHLVSNLRQGKDQLVVVYGTSLSSGDHGESWMREVADQLNSRYKGKIKYSLSGKSGRWSTWGIQHLEDSVIAKDPDVVMIEFGINDAFQDYKTSPEVAKLNLEYMIDRIQLANSHCEVILQVMNMPIRKSAGYRPNLPEYYNMYREVANRRKLLLIDHYPNWQSILNEGEETFLRYVPDGIHPSDESGKNIIAPQILKSLENNACIN